MKIKQPKPGSTSTGTPSHLPAIFFGSLFILMGIGAAVWLGLSIIINPDVQPLLTAAESSQTPALVMAILLEFGILLPVLVICASVLIIRLGIRFFSGKRTTARWGQVILLWLAAGSGILMLLNGLSSLSRHKKLGAAEAPVLTQNQIMWMVGLFLLMLLFLLCSLWLKRHINHYFPGNEPLKASEVRFAWNLLIPTLAVLIFVAGRPLEQTFIRSLTDKRFAGQGVPNFVGLENYANLLGVRMDVVDCRMDVNTGECALSPNGSLQWETIQKDALKEGFRPVWTLKLPFSKTTKGLTLSGLDRDFIKGIWTTLIFTVISVSLELLLAMFIALTVNSNFKGRGFMRAVMLIPWAIPTVISARLWENMLKDTSAGIINKVLLDLNLIQGPQAWLSIPALQIPSAIMVDVWKTAPFMALLLLAGLQIISEDLYEAASVDGANGFQKFFWITLPLLRPTIAVALVFRTLDALRVFDLFNVLFSRQQLTMATYNYEMLVGSQRDGYASAISIIIFILISIFAVLYVRLLNVETE